MVDGERVALTINVRPSLEERVVDWLLARELGFTSYPAFGHGAGHEGLTIAEQVSGRQRRIEFRVELAHEALDALVAALADRFAGADLYFNVVPVLRSGHLRAILKKDGLG